MPSSTKPSAKTALAADDGQFGNSLGHFFVFVEHLVVSPDHPFWKEGGEPDFESQPRFRAWLSALHEGDLMEPRIDFRRHAQGAQKAMLALEQYIGACGLDHKLIHLMKMRASQINGCAYCLDMHSKDARAIGETEQRLYALDAWSETPFYTDKERAALAWTEALTLVSETHVPDFVYEEVRKYFNEKEIVDLTVVATTINAWNRLCISLRAVPGHYRPAASIGAAG
jgi:AhpD family alkylhydroperoxidase